MLMRGVAHDQGGHPGVLGQHFEHRVDEHVRALLAPDASKATDSHVFGQTERAPVSAPVCGGVEHPGVDSMHDHARRPAQIGRGFA